MNEILILMKSEWVLLLIIIIFLFIKVGSAEWENENLLYLSNILLLINFILGFVLTTDGIIFDEMFKTNSLICLEKNILNFGTLIISLQSYHWLKNHKHIAEFYMLLLSTLLGIFFMISSNNLLMFYLGLELSTIPLAALANFDLHKRQSSEAAFKLIISSALSSGLLLFGISLLYGTSGTLNLSEISQHLNGSNLQLFAFILLIAGFAFKISAVPFHLWTADVYEGSPVAVTSYLSVISKGAVLFVFISVLYTVFKSLGIEWYNMLILLSVLTMIIGNLFAIRQNNIKRLLAYSSIAQVGFILAGISGCSQLGTTSVIYFVLIYVFSNLGAFGVVSIISSTTGKETISDYKGLYKSNPFLSWTITIALFSLAGIPPTAGFFGKFFLIMSAAQNGNYLFISIAALNMVISLYYYLILVKAIFMDTNEQAIEKIHIPILPKIAMLICTAGIIIVGLYGEIYEYIFKLSFGY